MVTQENLEKFLGICGGKGTCNGCGETIYWFKTRKGKNMPVNPDLSVHWETCPAASSFRRKSGGPETDDLPF